MKIQLSIFLLLTVFTTLPAQDNPAVFINEFLASNVSIDADIVDFDDYSDWIELYNDEPLDVNIGGWYLTDNVDQPFKWIIPDGTMIGAKGYLRFWADSYDDIPGRTYIRPYRDQDGGVIRFTTRYYHLNFNLSRAGELIALYNSTGDLVDSVTYGLQLRDVSMGRQPDGAGDWFLFGEPTPLSSNNTEGTLSSEYAEAPGIFPESGFYSGTQTITITADNDADIRYTLNGSRPGSSSDLYTEPLPITQTTVLRTRVFEAGKLPSPIITRTYFIDENISLPVISLAFFPETFWDNSLGIYDNNYKNREVPVHFELFHSDGLLSFNLDAGLELTGQASLYYPQKSFTIYTSERFGTDVIEKQVFRERELNLFNALYLRNAGVPDHRVTFFRDALQHGLIMNKMDIDCQAYLPAVVFLNGAYWGILNIRDKINTDYLASLHNINPDDIDLLEYENIQTPTVMDGDRENYTAFHNYIKANDLSIDEHYRTVEAWMDMDEYINYMITEIYCDNTTWLSQNVRMWRERKESARWRWIFFDMDFGFGLSNPSAPYSNNTLGFATSSNMDGNNAPEWATLIFRKLLSNLEFRNKFIQRFAGYMNSVFQPDTVLAAIGKMQAELNPEIARHIARWRSGEWYYGYPIQNYSEWMENVQLLKNFARNRPRYQREHIVKYFHLDGTFYLNLVAGTTGAGSVVINDVDKVMTSRSGLYFKNIPLELNAVPGVGYRFVRWEGLEDPHTNPQSLVPETDTLNIHAVFEPENFNSIPSFLSRDTTLSISHSPYYALKDVTIDSHVTLIIEEGVKIFMPAKTSIIVHGKLIVAGTEENPVTIAPYEYADRWGALCFINATDSSSVSHCLITGASKGPDFTRDRAAISGYRSVFSLQNVTVKNSVAPVFSRYGKTYVRNCTLRMAEAGDLINIKQADYALVENCDLRGNDQFDSDGIDYDQLPEGTIRGNHIYNFYGFNSDAIDLGEDSHNILIEHNIIYNIDDKGVSIGNGSTGILKRNVISNCGQGVGIKDYDSYGYIEHTTLYANTIGVASFVKNIGQGGGTADIVNCIIANSRSSAVYVDDLSTAAISYSLSNTDDLPGLHNLQAEPLFLNNLSLSAGSPAINQGHPSLPPDPDGSLPDIGAYPFQQEEAASVIINEIHYNPSEGAEYEFIELVNSGSKSVHLNGFSLAGDIVYTFSEELLEPDEYLVLARNSGLYPDPGIRVLQWTGDALPNGSGSLLMRDDSGMLVDFVRYANRFWWPREPDGAGPSLELHHPSLENLVSANWRASYRDGGTPGKSNNSVLMTGLFINEMLAGNTTVNADEYGEHDDWIEIYNSNGFPVNVGGLYVTDNLDRPCKYQIPFSSPAQTTIPADGFILIWADDQSEQGPLHANFKLDRAGEQTGLVQLSESDTLFLDSLSYGEQMSDISLGRLPDGSANWHYFSIPSPLDYNINGTGIEPEKTVPEKFALFQNYPNPFNSGTLIRYTVGARLSGPLQVELSIYNILGQKIATLVSERHFPGAYTLRWDASDYPSGIYYLRLTLKDQKQTVASLARKMIIIK